MKKELRVGMKITEGLAAEPAFVNKMVRAIMDGLDAEITVFSKGDSEGRTRPDGRTRLEAFKTAMSYIEGLPLQRTIVANLTPGGFSDMNDIKQAVAQSPAMLSGLKRMLEDIDATKKPDPKRIEPAGKPT